MTVALANYRCGAHVLCRTWRSVRWTMSGSATSGCRASVCHSIEVSSWSVWWTRGCSNISPRKTCEDNSKWSTASTGLTLSLSALHLAPFAMCSHYGVDFTCPGIVTIQSLPSWMIFALQTWATLSTVSHALFSFHSFILFFLHFVSCILYFVACFLLFYL